MTEMTVGIRELKARLSNYMQQVKAGATLVITERGKPVGRIVPLSPAVEAWVQELVQARVDSLERAQTGSHGASGTNAGQRDGGRPVVGGQGMILCRISRGRLKWHAPKLRKRR